MSTHVGEVHEPTKEDFDYFIGLVRDKKGWAKSYSSKSKTLPISAFTRVIEGNDIKAVKVHLFKIISQFKVESFFRGASAVDVYESLQDPDYRRTWDESMKEGTRVCYVSQNSEIGYYRCNSFFRLIFFF